MLLRRVIVIIKIQAPEGRHKICDPFMNKIFISYSHKDKEWVKDYLLFNLEKQGIECHIDYRDFEIGVPSLINMERAVETCEKTGLPLWKP